MLRFIGKFAVLTLLWVIPLQGIAAAASILECLPLELQSFGSSNAGDREHGSALKEFSGHFYCHQLFPGILVVSAGTAAVDSSYPEPSIPLPPNLFFPEQPQRPPLSARV